MSLEQFINIPEILRPDELKFCEQNPDYPFFLEQVKKDITQINSLIDNFNSIPDKQNLELVHSFYLEMIHKYRGDFLKRCRIHSQQLKKLYSQLYIESQQFYSDGKSIFSISDEVTQQSSIHELANLIAGLSEESCDELLELLLHPIQMRMDNPVLSDKLPTFKAFLQNHQINFLAGENSKNFVITTAEGATFVLSAYNNLDNPQTAAKLLQQKSLLKNSLNPIYFQRQSQNIFKNYYQIQLSAYSPQKDLVSIAAVEHQSKIDESSLISKTLIYFTQMSIILNELSSSNLAFPDMKISNWSALSNGQLVLLDFKSIMFTNTEKQISRTENREKGYPTEDFLYTDSYMTPEMSAFLRHETDFFSAEKMHCHILGLNLGQFLYGPKNKDRFMIRTSSSPILQKLVKLIDILSNQYEEPPNMLEIYHQLHSLLLGYADLRIEEISQNIEPPGIIFSLRNKLQASLRLSDTPQITTLFELCNNFDLNISQLRTLKTCPFNQKNSPFNLYFKSFKDKLENCDSLVLYQETHGEIMRFNQLISEANTLLSTLKLDFSFSDEDTAMNTYIEGMHQRFIEAGSLQEIESIIAEINADIQNLNSSRFNEVKTVFLEMKVEKKLPEQLESIENILKRLPLKERMLPLSDRPWHNAIMAISAYNRSLSSKTMFKPTEGSVAEPTPKQGPTHD
jgi:hypothetical protein